VAIAHTLLKIAYSVLKSGKPYQEPGEDFCTRRRNPRNRQAWLEAELRKLHPGRPVTVIIGPGDDDSREGPPAFPARRVKVRCRAPSGTQFPCHGLGNWRLIRYADLCRCLIRGRDQASATEGDSAVLSGSPSVADELSEACP
jgi:hypothetical protein